VSSQRAGALRAAIEQRMTDLFTTLRPLSSEQWTLICPDEGWPVGYVAHHIGQGFARPGGWIEQALAGDDPFDFSWEVTHALNARRRQRLGLPSKDDALTFLRLSASHFAELVGSLSDAQLEVAGFRQGSVTRTIEWIAKIVIRHVDEHHEGIRLGLASAP
jgi:hypothetical protein